MRTFTQANRRLKFYSDAAGDDVLQLIAFTGTEELSRPFQFTLELVSNSIDVQPSKIVGTRVSFSIMMADESDTPRWFDGFVSNFSYRGTDDRSKTSHYRAEVVPWIWFMDRTSDCRIFQGMTIPEIALTVLHECPNSSFDYSGITGNYPRLEYCVQYRETDLSFVSRLLERAGIYFFFSHAQGSHKLILADTKAGYVDCKEASVSLRTTQSQSMDDEMLLSWEHRAQFHSGAIASTDYNFKTPATSLLTAAPTSMKLHDAGKYELFEYPGKYPTTKEGDAYTHVRMEEQETMHDVVVGRSECATFHPGGRFTLGEHYNPAEQGAWTIVHIKHEANLGGAYGSVTRDEDDPGTQSDDATYVNDFVCIPATTEFRPPRRTPRPMVGGLQTAVVVGEAGQEIQVDNFGRIRVQFFWDRYGKHGARASRWVRVAQTWAGPGYGAWFLPRIGHEVVVAFEEGDPDCPIIVGSVYHATNTNPYALPGNKTQSGIKTRSSMGGGPGNFNEIMFEDKKGSELLSIQAEKDRSVLVKHNNSESIGNDESLNVGHDRTKGIANNETNSIGSNRTETVGANETITIGSNRTEKVGSNETISIGASRTENVTANESITIGIAQTLTVGAAQTITVGAAQAVTVGADQATTVGGGQQISIGGSQTNTIGSDQTNTIGGAQSSSIAKDRSTDVGAGDSLNVAKALSINAGDEITITTGSASISMKKDGTISISGKDITIEGSGEINMKASKNVTIKGQKILQN